MGIRSTRWRRKRATSALLYAAAAVLALVGAAALGAGVARAQDASELERRVLALEEENARLKLGLKEAARRLHEAAEAFERLAEGRVAGRGADLRAEPRRLEGGRLEPADPAAAAAAVEAGGPLAPLRKAHRERDEDAIVAAEQGLIAAACESKATRQTIVQAFEQEKQFNVKVSLEWVLRSVEGKATSRDIVEAMRSCKDAGEKMRLAFLLGRFRSPEDAILLEELAATEQDPLIKKYVLRALGASEGAAGARALMDAARSSPDRNLRIEAIRALEDKKAPEVGRFLMDLAVAEGDASIRSIAIRALANVGEREAVEFFRAVLEKDDRTNNQAEAAKFFQRAGTAEDLPALEAARQGERVYYIQQKIQQAIEAIERREGREGPSEPGEERREGEPPPGNGKEEEEKREGK